MFSETKTYTKYVYVYVSPEYDVKQLDLHCFLYYTNRTMQIDLERSRIERRECTFT